MRTRSTRQTIFALATAALALCACKSKGVDMSRGGTELAYELKGGKTGEAALAEARKLALARLGALKVPAKAIIDGERLRVQIPKSVDAASLKRAKTALGLVGRFEVREVDDGASLRAIGPDIPEDAGARILQDNWTDHAGANRGAFTVVSASAQVARKVLETAGYKPGDLALLPERPLDPTQVRMYTVRAVALSNESIKSVSTPRDAYLPPEISIAFNESGSKAYEELTRKNLGRKIAFVVDDEILETAAVLAPVSVGKASISQPWTGTKEQQRRQAEVYAAAIKFGPMPAKLDLVEEREVARR
ncbi:MAG: SecDF P1 head subdomain-containing protein [Myxococcales bacterium]|jgi:preprotein translocase subunit SecD